MTRGDYSSLFGRRLGRLVIGVVLASTTFVVAASPASAHTAGGPTPTNQRSTLFGVVPPTPGVTATLLDLGRRIRLRNDSAVDVVVVGYHGEPYLRVGPAGVFENSRAPTLYENRTAPGGGAVPVPASADPSAPPLWHRRSGGHTVTWSDHRTRFSGPLPPAVTRAPHRPHPLIPQWAIPLQSRSLQLAAVGSVTWEPPVSALPWIAVAVALALAVALAGASRWWSLLLPVALAALIAVDIVHAVGVAALSTRGAGELAVRLLAGNYLSIVVWAIAVAAVAGLQRERDGSLFATAFCGAVIALLSGFTDLPSLTRSVLPSALPAVVHRAAVTVALGAGVGLLAGATLQIRRRPAPTSREASAEA